MGEFKTKMAMPVILKEGTIAEIPSQKDVSDAFNDGKLRFGAMFRPGQEYRLCMSKVGSS
jgi:hypothetical protein